ncbi:MAG TPA: DUF4381 domain-containing protein [Rudaea sp.]|nr:DUF4381 domain-containing protein [Rudaea sp.]
MTPSAGPQIRDIHVPPDPGWWPPAPGWWILACLGVLCLVWVLLKVRRTRKVRRQRRAILSELDRCISNTRGDPAALAGALSQYLRRIARTEEPAAAAWQGERWLEYLDRRSDSKEFQSGIGRVLLDAPYRPGAEYDTSALIALVRRWTRRSLDAGVANA